MRGRGEPVASEVDWTYRSVCVSLIDRYGLKTAGDPGEVRT